MSDWFNQMTMADTVIIAVVVVSVLISFLRGFVREAISLLVWAAAILLGVRYSTALGNWWFSGVHSPEMRFIIAFIILFLAIMIVGMVISAIIRALLDKTGLSIIDRLFGVIFGFVRGVLVVAMVLMFVGMSSWKNQDWVKHSLLVQTMQPLVKWLNSYVPEQMGQVSHWVGEKSE